MKRVTEFALLLMLGFVFAESVFAGSITLSNKYFQHNTSYSDTATMRVNWYSIINASSKSINNPIINTRGQNKVLLIWNQGANYDTEVTTTNYNFTITWTQAQQYNTKVTWKQTNSYADMTATVKAFD